MIKSLKELENIFNNDIDNFNNIAYLLSLKPSTNRFCLNFIAEKTEDINILENILNHPNLYGMLKDYVEFKLQNLKSNIIQNANNQKKLFKFAQKISRKYDDKIPFKKLINIDNKEFDKIEYGLNNYYRLNAYIQANLSINNDELEELLTNAVNLKIHNNIYIVKKDINSDNKFLLTLRTLDELKENPITIKNCYINIERENSKIINVQLYRLT